MTKILVVEDEAIAAMDIKNRLNNHGFEVVGTASKGKEAIEKAGKLKPDIVLMDITLKGDMDGIEAAEQLNTLFDVPVIYMSAFTDENTFERVKSSNPYGFVGKPISTELLTVSIEAAVYKHELDKKLAASENKYRNLYSSMAEGVVIYEALYDSDNNIVDFIISDINPAYESILGIKKSEIIGQKVTTVHKSDKLPYMDIFNKVAESGEPKHFETYSKPMNKYLDITVTSPENGKFATFFEDITERKKAEEALKESEGRFRSFYELPLIGIAITSPEKGWIETNDKICDILGYSREELYDISWDEITYPDDLDKDLKQFNRVLDGYIDGYSLEKRFIRKDGSVIYTNISVGCIRNEDNSVKYFVVLIDDISKNKRAEEYLAASEEKYRTLHESMRDAFASINMDGQIIEFNDIFREMLGYTEEELYNLTYIDLTPEKWHEMETEIIDNQVIPRGFSDVYEKEYIRKDGTFFPVELKTFLIRDEEGKPISMWAIIRDITERKKRKEELRESEEKFRVLSESSPIGIVVYRGSKHLYVNSAAVSIFEYPKEELLEMNFIDLAHPDYKEMIMNKAKARMKGNNEPDNYQVKMITKSGKEKWLDVTTSSIQYEGSSAGIVTFSDITLNKKYEEKNKSILENIAESYVEFDNEWRFVDINSNAEEIYGCKRDELIGNVLWELFPQSIGSKQYNEYHRAKKENVTVRFETKSIITKDWIELTVVPHSEGLTIYAQNINEWKKAAEELKESERNLNAFINALPEPGFLIKPNGEIIIANEALTKMFNTNVDDIAGLNIYDFLKSPMMVEKCKKVCQNIVKTKKPANFEEGNSKRTIKHFINPVFDSENNVYALAVITFNVTEHKNVEDELIQARDNLEEVVKKRTAELEEAYKKVAESEQKFREIFYNAYDMITLCGTGENGMPGRYIEVNDVACELLGYSRDELLKMTPMDFMSQESIAKVPETIEIMSEKGFATAEKVYIVKDGSEIPVEVNTHIFDLNGKKVGLAVSRDITKRKNREKQLREILIELERSNEELQQFAYVSSHDLQEPLRTIASFTQLLQRRYKGQLDEDADEFMDYIVEAAVRMKAQIEGLLEYSRVGTIGEEFELVDMNLILNQTINILDTSINENKVNIITDELPIVMGDAGQLQRVFQNLISNAIKFRKCEELLLIQISSNKDLYNKEYVFSIKDNGIGIEEQYSERIFTIFQRLHTRDVYKGTGIGLSIVKRIVGRHGGRVWVESEFGVGSTFYFTIPIRNE